MSQNNAALKQQESVSWYSEIYKRNEEKRVITAVVLKPEVTDAQGDILGKEVIQDAAYDFLARYRDSKDGTKLGYLHKEFNRPFLLVESYVAPSPLFINSRRVPEGSWIMSVKVLDNEVWKLIKSGQIRGFSIGGKAKVTKISI
jgi:hypothetical protein